ncbi:hypothetical protein B1B04_23265 [Lysinibacillus sp. KCTC 33748]|uniref:hypothetical protein n=1 Tax=unclassified Lysinibacillus TaxID=2636778 RepID=UPI0009A5FDE4|nr:MULTISPECIES: hypothetical protein [unclassified Lysinibacillus]OXS66977.1 hypothetical protein B1B04_23265 [Lysinibacillus sp. KCTC 33748]SKC16180.1 hypothetical protein SAMN06295926_13120 [Lysinibacillus sp. AC-3]
MVRGRVVEKELSTQTLGITENPLVEQAIKHLKEHKSRVNDDFVQTVFNVEYFEDEKESEEILVEQTQTYVQLSDEAQLRIIATKTNEKESLNVSAIRLGEKDGVPRVFVTAFENGQIIYEVDHSYDESQFKIPEDKEAEIEPYIAYLDCVWGSSCCTLAGKKYNWCGAGCGSGTPINDLDTCCKWHDNCYVTNTSYPGRCGCDKVLNACADQTNVDGAGVLISAFIAKMAWYGC